MAGTSSSGKKNNQQMKPYLVFNYLLNNSDEEHTVGAPRIIDYLKSMGFTAERRSIYRDIDSINKCLWILENNSTIMELEEKTDPEDFKKDKVIKYNSHTKGFYVTKKNSDKAVVPTIEDTYKETSPATKKSDNFDGTKERVKLLFNSALLDSVEECLGNDGVDYISSDDTHFKVTAEIAIGEQFYCWMGSFGTKAKILSPESVKNRYVKYLEKIMYKYW